MKILVLISIFTTFHISASSFIHCTSRNNITYSLLMKYQAVLTATNYVQGYKNTLHENVLYSNKVKYVGQTKHIQYNIKAKKLKMFVSMPLQGTDYGKGYVIDGQRPKETVFCRR